MQEHENATDIYAVHRPHDQKELRSNMRQIILIGFAMLTSLVNHTDAVAQDYPADVARGKAVYERHCMTCHGTGGWGDGPRADSLKIAPANFHRFSSFLKSDEELLRTIEHGIVFSPMHSWRGQLTDGEMQDVVAYIRLLSQQGR